MPITQIVQEFDRMRLKERLRKARGEITREKFAEMVGVSQSTIKNWESGETEPRISDILTLSKITGENPVFLAFGDLSEIENEDQIELTSSILSLEDKDLETAKEIIKALSLQSHARRLKV